MARPSTTADLPAHQRTVQLAQFELTEFADDPQLVQAYAAFVRRAQALGGSATAAGSPRVARPLTDAELDAKLAQAKRTWDHTEARYNAVCTAYAAGDLSTLSTPWQDYEATTLRMHAEREGYVAFNLISADKDARAEAMARAGI